MHKLIKRVFVFLILILLIIPQSFSQPETEENNRDFETWGSFGIEYDLNDKWSFGLEEELRLKNNSSVIDQYFTELNIDYTVIGNFKLGAGIRYIRENDDKGAIQGYENHLRVQFDASFKHKISSFSLKYRLRYQNKNELGLETPTDIYSDQDFRFKTDLTYSIKNWKLDPQFSGEIYYHLGETENIFNKYRLTVGTDYKFGALGKIGIFYRLEKEINSDLPRISDIVGINYTYSF